MKRSSHLVTQICDNSVKLIILGGAYWLSYFYPMDRHMDDYQNPDL